MCAHMCTHTWLYTLHTCTIALPQNYIIFNRIVLRVFARRMVLTFCSRIYRARMPRPPTFSLGVLHETRVLDIFASSNILHVVIQRYSLNIFTCL